MNKYALINTVAIIIIVIVFAHSGINIVGAEWLEYRWHEPEEFSLFVMSNSGKIELCNMVPFWASFQKFEIVTSYDGMYMGSFITGPMTLNPLASSEHEGVFISERRMAAQHNFMTLDFESEGGDIRLDPSKFVATVRINTPIIGVIPYSTTTHMVGFDIYKIIGSKDQPCG